MKLETSLILALNRVGKESDILFQLTEDLPSDGIVATISEICRQSNVRYRQVNLPEGWWKRAGEPLLVFLMPNSLPACAFMRGDSWFIEIPDQRAYPIDEDISSQIQAIGYVFYPTLPKSAGLLDLLKLAFQGTKPIIYRYLFLQFLAASLAILAPFFYKLLFDQIIPNANYSLLAKVFLILIVLGFSTFTFQLVGSLMMLRFEGLAQNRLQVAIWDRFFHLPVTFFKEYPAGDLIQRSEMADEIRKTLGTNTLNAVIGAVFATLYLIPMLYFSWQLTVIALLTLSISFVIAYLFVRYQVRMQRVLLEIGAEINQYLIQLVQGIAKIRVAGAENRAFKWWFNLFSESQAFDYAIGKTGSIVNIVTTAISTLSLTAIFATAIYLLQHNIDPSFTIGSFMAFNAAFVPFSQAFLTMLSLSMTSVVIIPTWERAKLIFEHAGEAAISQPTQHEVKGAVRLEQVNFHYPDMKGSVLHHINIEAKSGEFIGIVGPSGSGKSSILRLLLGFETPDTGQVFYDEVSLSSINKEHLRQQLGVCLQTSGIIMGTVYENITFGRKCTIENIHKAIRISCLDEVLSELPMGLDTVLPSGGGNLSGGQKQRILLARALAGNPKILILDEGTSALDNQTQGKIQKRLRALPMTQIVVAHRLDTLKEADRLYVIKDGVIVEEGKFDELSKKEGGLFAELLSYQKL